MPIRSVTAPIGGLTGSPAGAWRLLFKERGNTVGVSSDLAGGTAALVHTAEKDRLKLRHPEEGRTCSQEQQPCVRVLAAAAG
jgi:hypothetical protein